MDKNFINIAFNQSPGTKGSHMQTHINTGEKSPYYCSNKKDQQKLYFRKRYMIFKINISQFLLGAHLTSIDNFTALVTIITIDQFCV